MTPHPYAPLAGVLLAWLIAVTAVTVVLPGQRWPGLLVPPLTLALAGLLVWAYARGGALRGPLAAMPLAGLTRVHIVRLPLGLLLLVLARQAALNEEFAQVAGWGEVACGLLAIAVGWLPLEGRSWRWYTHTAWNVTAIGNLGRAIFLALNAMKTDPGSMAILTGYPFVLMPLLVMPVLLASHALAVVKLLEFGEGE